MWLSARLSLSQSTRCDEHLCGVRKLMPLNKAKKFPLRICHTVTIIACFTSAL